MKNNLSNGMNLELFHIIENFDNSGIILVEGNRNLIKIFDYQGKSIAIKSFKKPMFINGFIYKFFRDSKAKRSFDNANFLISKNIGTPKPIAFIEKSNFLFLKESYYICENLEYNYMFRKVFEGLQNPDLEYLLRSIADFTFRMHENGIEFLDHSPGNTLIKIDENGNFNCFLVDLNRMEFHKKMSLDLRLKNMNKLTPSFEMIVVIANEYAKLINIPEKIIFDNLWANCQKFYHNYDRKQFLKKKFMFWKN
ncbi:MAG: Kdo domain containing protein [Flavobacterium sp.]|nr:Kdo domain containing protein [Flavobacterium sp.]